jgi:hypothetical protein
MDLRSKMLNMDPESEMWRAEPRGRKAEGRGEGGCTIQRPQYLACTYTVVGHIWRASHLQVSEIWARRQSGGEEGGPMW